MVTFHASEDVVSYESLILKGFDASWHDSGASFS